MIKKLSTEIFTCHTQKDMGQMCNSENGKTSIIIPLLKNGKPNVRQRQMGSYLIKPANIKL